MSRFIELIFAKSPAIISGLVEQFTSFGGEQVETEPRVFIFAELVKLTLRPPPPHVLARVAAKVPNASMSLVFDEALVLEWATDRLSERVRTLLRALFAAMEIAQPYAVAVETGIGEGTRMLIVDSSMVFDTIDSVVKGQSKWDLTIVVVEVE